MTRALRRGLTWLGVLATCTAFVALLLAASHHGEASRCAWLTAHQSPATSTYDCTTTGAP